MRAYLARVLLAVAELFFDGEETLLDLFAVFNFGRLAGSAVDLAAVIDGENADGVGGAGLETNTPVTCGGGAGRGTDLGGP